MTHAIHSFPPSLVFTRYNFEQNNAESRTMIIKNQRMPLKQTVPGMRIPAYGNQIPLPEILFITSYPSRECGIATYSHDLVKALNSKFDQSFTISICALESENEKYTYPFTN